MSLEKFFTSNPENERVYIAFKISHSQMSQDYYFVDDTEDLTVTDPQITGGVFTSEAIIYGESRDNNDLDRTASLMLNDFTSLIDDELDNIDLDSSEAVAVDVFYYHSSDLSEPAIQIAFECASVTQDAGIATLALTKPVLNKFGTGVTYDTTTFPMLRT